jgi:hypothetical protein
LLPAEAVNQSNRIGGPPIAASGYSLVRRDKIRALPSEMAALFFIEQAGWVELLAKPITLANRN